MGVAMIDSCTDAIPIQRFMQELVRDSSLKGNSEKSISKSAKSVMDFDASTNIDRASMSASSHDTFNIHSLGGLLLVSDNARVFAKARPKQSKDLLTSQSWHSSSELRKMHTGNSRWSGNSPTLPQFRKQVNKNKTFSRHTTRPASSTFTASSTANANVDRRVTAPVQRRTSDSCLTIPKRSWMRRPKKSKASKAAALVSSRFAASSVETAMEARNCRSEEFSMPSRAPSSPSDSCLDDSSSSGTSFCSADADDVLEVATAVMSASANLHTRKQPRDSAELRAGFRAAANVAIAANQLRSQAANLSWSPPRPAKRTGIYVPSKSSKQKQPQQSSRIIRKARSLVNTAQKTTGNGESSSCGKNYEFQRSPGSSHDRLSPIPPSLLLSTKFNRNRFEATSKESASADESPRQAPSRAYSVPSTHNSLSVSRLSLQSLSTCPEDGHLARGPRLSRSRSSRSSGSKLSTRVRSSNSMDIDNMIMSNNSSNNLIGSSSSHNHNHRAPSKPRSYTNRSSQNSTTSRNVIGNNLIGSSSSSHNYRGPSNNRRAKTGVNRTYSNRSTSSQSSCSTNGSNGRKYIDNMTISNNVIGSSSSHNYGGPVGRTYSNRSSTSSQSGSSMKSSQSCNIIHNNKSHDVNSTSYVKNTIPISTLERALGDMAPKRPKGRRLFGKPKKTKSSRG